MPDSAPRVLVVDDEASICLSLCEYLEDQGFSVLAAANGEEALDVLMRESVDVAIIDMRLPGMDGNALILKAHELRPSLEFLVYTGSTNYQLPAPLRALGISPRQVFRKPVGDLLTVAEAARRLVQNAKGSSDGH
jgi:CheY-like chemotaxis protein